MQHAQIDAHRLCVVQAEDRPLAGNRIARNAEGLARLLEHNRLSCAADANCTYLRRDTIFHDIQPHWRKAFIGYDVLNSTNCGAVAWLDSDTALTANPSELLALLRPAERPIVQARDNRYVWPPTVQPHVYKDIGRNGVHFALAGENDVFHTKLAGFNAGVWIVANTPLGHAIMQAWTNVWWQHASHFWRRDTSKPHTGQDDLSWSCYQPDEAHPGKERICDFSREHYEQGAFVKYVMAVERLRRAIRIVPWYVLQNPYPRTLVHHFIGHPPLKERELANFFRYSTPGTLLSGPAAGSSGGGRRRGGDNSGRPAPAGDRTGDRDGDRDGGRTGDRTGDRTGGARAGIGRAGSARAGSARGASASSLPSDARVRRADKHAESTAASSKKALTAAPSRTFGTSLRARAAGLLDGVVPQPSATPGEATARSAKTRAALKEGLGGKV